jgi:hypothetical protein
MKKISKQRQAELGEFMAKIEIAAKAEGKNDNHIFSRSARRAKMYVHTMV